MRLQCDCRGSPLRMPPPPSLGCRIRNGIWEAGLLVVLPLAFCRGFAEQFSTPKLFLIKTLIISGLAVWILGKVWNSSARRIDSKLFLPVLAFSAAVLTSCLASPARRFSLTEAEYALCGPAWLLIITCWEQGETAVRKIAILTGFAGAVVAGVTLLQRLGFDPVLLGGYQVDWGSMAARMRLYSTFGNPNFVGGYLIGTIFAALALAIGSKTRRGRVLWSLTALMMQAAIVETGSHGAWLGLAMGLIAAGIVLYDQPHQGDYQNGSGQSFCSFIPPGALWPVGLIALPLLARMAAQLHGRIYLWRFSCPLFLHHPIFGSGWGTYQLDYLNLQAAFLSAHPDDVGYWTNNRLLHNDPLQLLLETGLVGFAAFAWVSWSYGKEALKVRRESASAWTPCAIAASVGGVTAILTDSIFNYQFAVPPTYLLLFTLLAIPTLLQRGRAEAEGEWHSSKGPLTHRKDHQTAWKIAISVAILCAAACLMWQQTRRLMSERFYQLACDLEDRNDLAGAESTFRRSVALNELNGRAHFGLSRVLYSRGRSFEALVEIVRAEQTYADAHQEILRGLILTQMGNPRDALEAYRHAVWLDPSLTSMQMGNNSFGKPQ